jgi:hypothetical protein
MTRLPQLEQELVAAAARLQAPRRMARTAARSAVAVAAAAAVALAIAVLDTEDGGRRAQPAGAPPFPANAELEDMLGVFRRPQTPADDLGYTKEDLAEITDRQPGEDPRQSRRVEWPDATIFLWPMRDGVCDSVRPDRGPGSGSGCVPLEHLRRHGVTVGTHSSGGRQSVYGIVVDGIREVVLTSSKGPDVRVAVSKNFFFLDLTAAARDLGIPGWDGRGARLSWRYAGRERSFDLSPALVPTVVPPDVPEGAPRPDVDPVAESVSRPFEFTVAGTRYAAVGFHTRRTSVCAALTNLERGPPPSTGCLSERLLRSALERGPAHLFAAGGGGTSSLVHTGFALGEVVEVAPAEPASEVTVRLSEPWRPEPWRGDPIRFFFVFDRDPGEVKPRQVSRISLTARLSDGRVLEVP